MTKFDFNDSMKSWRLIEFEAPKDKQQHKNKKKLFTEPEKGKR